MARDDSGTAHNADYGRQCVGASDIEATFSPPALGRSQTELRGSSAKKRNRGYSLSRRVSGDKMRSDEWRPRPLVPGTQTYIDCDHLHVSLHRIFLLTSA